MNGIRPVNNLAPASPKGSALADLWGPGWTCSDLCKNRPVNKSQSISSSISWHTSCFFSLSLCFNGHFPDGSGLASTRTSSFWRR